MKGLLISTDITQDGVFSHVVNADNHNEQLRVRFLLAGGSLRCMVKGTNHPEYQISACNSLEEAKRCLPSLAIESGLNVEEEDLQNFIETVWQYNSQLRNLLALH